MSDAITLFDRHVAELRQVARLLRDGIASLEKAAAGLEQEAKEIEKALRAEREGR